MLTWVQANKGSIVVAAAVLLIVVLIVRRLILDKKAGRHICGGSCTSCGGGCAGCPMHGQCHVGHT